MLFGAISGWVYHFLQRKRKQLIYRNNDYLLYIFLLIFFVSVGLCWHMIQSYIAWGHPTTNPWYGSIAFPFLLCFAYEGARCWHDKVAFTFGWLITSLYFFTEIYGMVIKMPIHYSGGLKGIDALSRIAHFHPVWLGTKMFIFSYLNFVTFLIFFVYINYSIFCD